MRVKRVALVSIVTFLLGGLCGSAYAYVSYSFSNTNEDISLSDNLEQVQENIAVEQFVKAQEEQRPNGLEESKIETGSKYTGITYNNVATATVSDKTETDPAATDDGSETKKEEGLLSSILNWGKNTETNKQDKTEDDKNSSKTSSAGSSGKIAIQKGSLNVRAQGSIEGDVIGQVYKGDIVQIVSQDGAWYQIITSDGTQGYVSATYVEVVN
ncbi:MAG: SH3 domain-containing protein [Peptococcaceae bacterium]